MFTDSSYSREFSLLESSRRDEGFVETWHWCEQHQIFAAFGIFFSITEGFVEWLPKWWRSYQYRACRWCRANCCCVLTQCHWRCNRGSFLAPFLCMEAHQARHSTVVCCKPHRTRCRTFLWQLWRPEAWAPSSSLCHHLLQIPPRSFDRRRISGYLTTLSSLLFRFTLISTIRSLKFSPNLCFCSRTGFGNFSSDQAFAKKVCPIESRPNSSNNRDPTGQRWLWTSRQYRRSRPPRVFETPQW